MRQLEELRSRVFRNEIIPAAEMAAKYYPTDQSFRQVAAWFSSAGLQVQPPDLTRLSLAASGSTGTVAKVLKTRFVRVTGIDGQEYSSAISAPTIPSDFAFVIGIHGLQPQLKSQIRPAQLQPAGNASLPAAGPRTIAQHYAADGLGLDGTGQAIAIIGTGSVDPKDIAKFWMDNGLSGASPNVSVVNPWSNTGSAAAAGEITMDMEWAGAMAPSAEIRLYASVDPAEFVPAILSDLQANPGLRQVSFSSGYAETVAPASLIEAESQYYAALAAAGVTVYAASGDWGQYSCYRTAKEILEGQISITVVFPASDPCVTAVGGTTLQFISGLISSAPLRSLNPDTSEILVLQKQKSEIARVEFAKAGPTQMSARSFVCHSGNWISHTAYEGPVKDGKTTIPLVMFEPSYQLPKGRSVQQAEPPPRDRD